MKESELVKKILQWQKPRRKIFLFKNHQAGYTQAGIPDIVGNVGPNVVYLECKVGRNKPTKLQEATINNIRRTGAAAFVVWSLEEAIEVLTSLEASCSSS